MHPCQRHRSSTFGRRGPTAGLASILGALVALTLFLTLAPGTAAAQLFGGPAGGPPGGAPPGPPIGGPKPPPGMESHAASGGDSSTLPKTEAQLPEDPLDIPDEAKKRLGPDRDEDDFSQGTTDETEVDFYGLYYAERSGTYQFRTAFPFWFERTQPDDRASLFGPYYNRRSKDHDADVAFPFFWRFRDKEETTWVIPPFVHQEAPATADKPSTHANWLPPLFFEGKTSDGGGYFHIPPLLTFTEHSDRDGLNIVGPLFCKWKGGSSCDARTADVLDMGIAPFYFYGRDRTSEYEIIPPLLHYYHYDDVGESETNLWGPLLWQRDREGGVFNVMPFYWQNWGKDEEHITLFPLFHYGYEGSSHLLITPLFLEAEGKDGEDTFVTWGYARYRGRTELDMITPLFWWYRDPDIGLDTKILFPFYYQQTSPRRDDLAIFPFYGHFERPGISKSTFITPLFEHNTSLTGWYTNLYPLFYSGRTYDSTHLVVAPFLFDFASPKSRTTIAFPVFFRFADQQGVSQLALNTYYTEKKVAGGTDWEFHFFPAFSFGGMPNGHWWNVLYGLVGWTSKGETDKLRLLYIPITVSD